ncbi:conserved hypothetical protein [Frankia sp. AiPs1]|nr:DUF433 domain-containing protein [Frankia sp. AiPa1]
MLWEHVDAGEDPEEIAEDFDLTLQDVKWALADEYSARAA